MKIQAALDRCQPDGRKSIVAYSTEIRQLDLAVARMLKELDFTAEPVPMTLRQIRNQRAANTRWNKADAAEIPRCSR
ncbi:MAG: hypothetical protein WAL41_12920 [Mycobacterium sp.]